MFNAKLVYGSVILYLSDTGKNCFASNEKVAKVASSPGYIDKLALEHAPERNVYSTL